MKMKNRRRLTAAKVLRVARGQVWMTVGQWSRRFFLGAQP